MHFRPAHTPPVSCTKCGERLFVPEASEYFEANSVRHYWKCEPCGYSFETTACFGAQRGRRRSDQQRPLSATRGSW
jgi:DNA-directed RNA polymerase subunit RPC12/RpoP